MSVSALMASPLCQGLFAQAMGSSGSVMGFKKIATQKEAEEKGVQLAQKIAEKMGKNTGKKVKKNIGMKNLNELRALPAEELMKLAGVRAVPVYNIDGYFMKEQPVDVFAKGEQTKVPLLIGGNNQEMTPWAVLMGKQPTVKNLKAGAKATFGLGSLSK